MQRSVEELSTNVAEFDNIMDQDSEETWDPIRSSDEEEMMELRDSKISAELIGNTKTTSSVIF